MLRDAAPLLALFIPILAIVGGIIAGITKILAKQRIAELAYRERIAAIERGIDPSQLPAAPLIDPDVHAALGSALTSAAYARHRAQGLLIGGIVTTFAGIALIAFFAVISDERRIWVLGLVPTAVGLALLLSARVIWPRDGGTEERPAARGTLGT